jgi:hypothetical protein
LGKNQRGNSTGDGEIDARPIVGEQTAQHFLAGSPSIRTS